MIKDFSKQIGIRSEIFSHFDVTGSCVSRFVGGMWSLDNEPVDATVC